MNIRNFSQNLQILYKEMAEVFTTYQDSTGLACLNGCGRCCKNPDIEATVLEMIPFALKIWDEGKIDEWLVKLENSEGKPCLIFEGDPEKNGRCGSYEHRPSICRMFGVAGYFDKEHRPILSVCKFIKEDKPELLAHVEKSATSPNPPMLSYWSSKLGDLDPQLIQERMPINQAIRKALEKTALYAQYQEL